MNLFVILFVLILIALGAVWTVFTHSFGIICVWPLFILGFLLFLGGIVLPFGSISFFQKEMHHEDKREIKRICPHCRTTNSIEMRGCPNCRQRFDY